MYISIYLNASSQKMEENSVAPTLISIATSLQLTHHNTYQMNLIHVSFSIAEKIYKTAGVHFVPPLSLPPSLPSLPPPPPLPPNGNLGIAKRPHHYKSDHKSIP